MKKNIVGAIVATVTFVIIYLLLDLIFGDTHSFREYAVQAVIFCFVWCLGRFLDERGWNSWNRIGDLFKRKKTDDSLDKHILDCDSGGQKNGRFLGRGVKNKLVGHK